MAVKPGWARKKDRLRRREADAARTGTTGTLWALSAAEWRLLVITFVGGLGSLIAAACVIGGAIALARYQESFGLGSFGVATAIGLFAGVLVLVIFRYILPIPGGQPGRHMV